MRFLKLLSILAIQIILINRLTTTTAHAENDLMDDKPIQVFAISQQDNNGDGIPDVTVIECAFTNGHDRVVVYDQNGDMNVGTDWEAVTDFKDDIWIFDAGADGTAQLIIDFNVEEEKSIALIYDDLNDDGKVSYNFEEKLLSITESRNWHLKIISENTWEYPMI